MSHLIITFIGITKDDRVIIERTSNNLRPLEFRTVEIEPQTALYREQGHGVIGRGASMALLSRYLAATIRRTLPQAIGRYKQT
ncbi:MAG: hypothetical protein K2I62_05040, partial [Alistipes sp.]|nr:hypothetical protein [Alistipes sp.]